MADPISTIDAFDLAFGQLDGLPDTLRTQQATVTATTPIVGHAETFIVQTVRQVEVGDTVFLQVLSAARSLRLVIPPRVMATLARQRDSLDAKRRVAGARKAVQTKRDKGQRIGNPEALKRARAKRKRA